MRAIFASGHFLPKKLIISFVQDLLHLSTTIDGKYKICRICKGRSQL